MTATTTRHELNVGPDGVTLDELTVASRWYSFSDRPANGKQFQARCRCGGLDTGWGCHARVASAIEAHAWREHRQDCDIRLG